MPANLSRPGDPDPSRSTQAVALQDPDLLDSIVNGYVAGAKRERRHHEPRYREAALFSPTQTAGFRSDATSDRADRLYILNRCEVMYKAESARQCSGAGAQCKCQPSSVWNPSLHRQLHRPLSCRRGTPYSSGPIPRRCLPGFQHRQPHAVLRTGRPASLHLNNAGACV